MRLREWRREEYFRGRKAGGRPPPHFPHLVPKNAMRLCVLYGYGVYLRQAADRARAGTGEGACTVRSAGGRVGYDGVRDVATEDLLAPAVVLAALCGLHRELKLPNVDDRFFKDPAKRINPHFQAKVMTNMTKALVRMRGKG